MDFPETSYRTLLERLSGDCDKLFRLLADLASKSLAARPGSDTEVRANRGSKPNLIPRNLIL